MAGRWRDGRGRLIVPGGAGDGDGGGDGEAGAAAVTVPLELAASYRARTRGLLGRDAVDGALLLSPAGSIHTFGMRIPIDVAYLDRGLRVLAVVTMRPGRLGRPRLRSRHVLEAAAGAMARWGVRAGVRVSVEADFPAGSPGARQPD
ncbi:DUF192 domain-containing protein [Streptomyces sp. NRRL S-340]|uniref:DUF192 domain-containing protein n=1 Tax=Streptomyces sp. NRRL S-340 TaxID=1463901 RepID=UPI00056650A3|nr:DUF192 domain-containing protein [Streptomyces sp. NRRL S-340]